MGLFGRPKKKGTIWRKLLKARLMRRRRKFAKATILAEKRANKSRQAKLIAGDYEHEIDQLVEQVTLLNSETVAIKKKYAMKQVSLESIEQHLISSKNKLISILSRLESLSGNFIKC